MKTISVNTGIKQIFNKMFCYRMPNPQRKLYDNGDGIIDGRGLTAILMSFYEDLDKTIKEITLKHRLAYSDDEISVITFDFVEFCEVNEITIEEGTLFEGGIVKELVEEVFLSDAFQQIAMDSYNSNWFKASTPKAGKVVLL